MKRLDQVLQRLEQTRKAQQDEKKIALPPHKPAKIIQLPVWPEPARGVPNSVLRGALFAAIQGKDRKALKRELLTVQQGIEIRFTGWQLDQADMDVWEQALHLVRQHPLGTRCDFSAHAFLKALGRNTGKSQHEWLKDVFSRLMGCGVEITHNRLTYGGNLLEFYRDERTNRYRLEINPNIKALYEAGFTQIDWEQRQRLRRKPLAQWLHGFLASHAEPYPLKVETLMRLSGSQNRQLAGFKRQLNAALNDLQTIGAIDDYDLNGGLVTIYRRPSGSQKRHLTRANPRKQSGT
jgi:hypothetical protein